MQCFVLLICLLVASFVQAFVVVVPAGCSSSFQKQLCTASASSSASSSSSTALNVKGFGKPEKAAKAVSTKSKAAIEREQAASTYDKMADSGVPQYNIFVKVKGAADTEYVPAGVMAIPRTAKIGNAVFDQQEELNTAVLRKFPKLKGEELEYGYNLKVYPDDPIRALVVEEASEDPIKRFFNALMDPINPNK